MANEALEPREEPLPPAAPSWLIALAAVVLALSAIFQIVLIRMGYDWGTLPRLALVVFQAAVLGGVLIQTGWRRPFALYLWILFAVFLGAFIAVVSNGFSAQQGPPPWTF